MSITAPTIDTPQVIFEELIAAINGRMASHPRSQQVAVGPSQLGDPCTRRLLRALAGVKEPRRPGVYDGWLATVGTATHSWLARAFAPPRYLVETRVTPGEVAGQEVTGSCDLFDTATGTVIDWKVLGDASLEAIRLHGPGAKYETQVQLYAHGMAARGVSVRQVMLVVLPRTKGLDGAVKWDDDYRPDVAQAALARATGLVTLLGITGLAGALAQFDHCDDWHCYWCRIDRRPSIPTSATPKEGTT